MSYLNLVTRSEKAGVAGISIVLGETQEGCRARLEGRMTIPQAGELICVHPPKQ